MGHQIYGAVCAVGPTLCSTAMDLLFKYICPSFEVLPPLLIAHICGSGKATFPSVTPQPCGNPQGDCLSVPRPAHLSSAPKNVLPKIPPTLRPHNLECYSPSQAPSLQLPSAAAPPQYSPPIRPHNLQCYPPSQAASLKLPSAAAPPWSFQVAAPGGSVKILQKGRGHTRLHPIPPPHLSAVLGSAWMWCCFPRNS